MQQQDRPEASQIVWLTPVDLHIEGQGHRILRGPCDALCYLVHEWSSIHGLYYERAKQSCIERPAGTSCPPSSTVRTRPATRLPDGTGSLP